MARHNLRKLMYLRLLSILGCCGCLVILAILALVISILAVITGSTIDCNVAPLLHNTGEGHPSQSNDDKRLDAMVSGMQMINGLRCGCKNDCPPGIAAKADGVNKICNCTMGGTVADVLRDCICPNIDEVCGTPSGFPMPSICGVPLSRCTPAATGGISSGTTILPPGTSSGTTVLPPGTSSGTTLLPPGSVNNKRGGGGGGGGGAAAR